MQRPQHRSATSLSFHFSILGFPQCFIDEYWNVEVCRISANIIVLESFKSLFEVNSNWICSKSVLRAKHMQVVFVGKKGRYLLEYCQQNIHKLTVKKGSEKILIHIKT